MRQLSGCDFCGGTASGTFEVLPAEYDPEGEGKRMLLCDHCRDALSSVLDPLLDAKGSSTPAGDVEPNLTGAADASTTDEAGDTPADTASAAASGDTDDADDAPATESRPGSQMAATGAGASSRVPKGYRKVLRFLENREMPMDRQAAVEMTAGAYDMDEEAVDAAIEHAVGHGRLKAYDGEIRRA
jgi:hypothetical protein